MNIETSRLIITEFTADMAEAVHRNSLDDDVRRFVPDEVFETLEIAQETVDFLMSRYAGLEDPLVYPVLLKEGTNIGYVQLVEIDEGYEIGYHIAKSHTGKGYAAEAVQAFLPVIMPTKGIREVYGICDAENLASRRVLEKCGFIKIYEGMGPYHGEETPICRYIYHA